MWKSSTLRLDAVCDCCAVLCCAVLLCFVVCSCRCSCLTLLRPPLFVSRHTDNLEFNATESILLTNPSNVPIDFWWTTKSDHFTVSPTKGTVDANKALKVEITYRPKGPEKRFEEDITLYVKNGPPKSLLCIAALPDAQCVLKRKVVDFGQVCVGTPVDQNVQLKNTGKTATVFRWVDLPPFMRVAPRVGRVEAGQTVTVVMTLVPAEAAKFDCTLVRHAPVVVLVACVLCCPRSIACSLLSSLLFSVGSAHHSCAKCAAKPSRCASSSTVIL